jgi:exosome complex component RRP46
VQVTLQVVSQPEVRRKEEYQQNPVSELSILPALLHAALLALLSANIPLEATLAAALTAVVPADALVKNGSDSIVVLPTPSTDMSRATSLHVFAFTPERELLLSESEGNFDFEMWERAYEEAEKACCGQMDIQHGSMDVEVEEGSLQSWLRNVVREKVEKDQRWRTGS